MRAFQMLESIRRSGGDGTSLRGAKGSSRMRSAKADHVHPLDDTIPTGGGRCVCILTRRACVEFGLKLFLGRQKVPSKVWLTGAELLAHPLRS
jgi:hypothetical protein